MFEDLAIQRRDNCVLHPLLEGSGKFRLLLPKTTDSDLVVHMRKIGADFTNVVRYVEPTSPLPDPAALEGGTYLYGGPLFLHYGHAIAESIHRLWPILSSVDYRSIPILFHTPPHFNGCRPRWLADIFRYLGVDNQILSIDRPMYLEHVLFPEQAKGQVFAKAPDKYVQLFGRDTNGTGKFSDRVAAKPLHIYVSRSRFHHSGSFFGETLIERTLKEAGFLVLYPEDECLDDLIDLYRSADLIVFSEGSAIHALELCGPIHAAILIIARRPVRFCQSVFGPIVDAVTDRRVIFGNDFQISPLDWNVRKEIPKWTNASAKIDLCALVAKIADLAELDIRAPDKADVDMSVQSDLLRYILDVRSTGRATSDEKLGHLLRLMRTQLAERNFP